MKSTSLLDSLEIQKKNRKHKDACLYLGYGLTDRSFLASKPFLRSLGNLV